LFFNVETLVDKKLCKELFKATKSNFFGVWCHEAIRICPGFSEKYEKQQKKKYFQGTREIG
jgi:hypothetical protein